MTRLGFGMGINVLREDKGHGMPMAGPLRVYRAPATAAISPVTGVGNAPNGWQGTWGAVANGARQLNWEAEAAGQPDQPTIQLNDSTGTPREYEIGGFTQEEATNYILFTPIAQTNFARGATMFVFPQTLVQDQQEVPFFVSNIPHRFAGITANGRNAFPLISDRDYREPDLPDTINEDDTATIWAGTAIKDRATIEAEVQASANHATEFAAGLTDVDTYHFDPDGNVAYIVQEESAGGASGDYGGNYGPNY